MANELGVPIGFGVGTELRSVREVRAQAVWAAAAGFGSFWVSQIFGVVPIVALAAIAADIGAPTAAELATPIDAVPPEGSVTALRACAGGWA